MSKDVELIDRINELLRFLPQFDNSDGKVGTWFNSGKLPNSATTMSFPTYSDSVEEFIFLVDQEFWRDYNYVPSNPGVMLSQEGLIGSASIEQIRTMLTYFVRGERFCDGHWNAMILSGRVAMILKRLRAIRDEIQVDS